VIQVLLLLTYPALFRLVGSGAKVGVRRCKGQHSGAGAARQTAPQPARPPAHPPTHPPTHQYGKWPRSQCIASSIMLLAPCTRLGPVTGPRP
jgi:hypothetical protein